MSDRTARFSVVAALVAALTVLTPAAALALHAANTLPAGQEWRKGGVSFTLEPSAGLIEGVASEMVYDYPLGDRFTISELRWDLTDVAVAGIQGGIGLGGRVRVNLGYWSALNEGDGRMVDRDWLYRGYFDSGAIDPDSIDENDWTDRSVHPDTTLDSGSLFDVNLSFVPLKVGRFALSVVQGYKRNQWKWSARGGSAVYTPALNPADLTTADLGQFRNSTVEFPAGVRVISYEQTYSFPYIGIAAAWSGQSLMVESHVLVSNAVYATDRDFHDVRSTLFEGEFSRGEYFGVGLRATWAFARHWAATLGVEYQVISELVGDVEITGPEGRWYDASGAGIAMDAAMVMLAAGYRF